MNEVETKRNIHKYKDFLATAGFGIIILIVWGLIKTIVYVRWFLPRLSDSAEQAYSWTATGLNFFEFALCLITGFLAKKFGKSDGKEKLILFILSVLLAVFGIAVMAGDLYFVIYYNDVDIISIISLVGDTLFLFFVVLILVSIFKLKKLYKIQKEVNNER